MHKLLGTGGVPTFLTFIVLAVADALFGFCGSERKDELFIGTQSRPPPLLLTVLGAPRTKAVARPQHLVPGTGDVIRMRLPLKVQVMLNVRVYLWKGGLANWRNNYTFHMCSE